VPEGPRQGGRATSHRAPQVLQGRGMGRLGSYGLFEEWWTHKKGWGSEGRWGESRGRVAVQLR
jgi:hypothetical protein